MEVCALANDICQQRRVNNITFQNNNQYMVHRTFDTLRRSLTGKVRQVIGTSSTFFICQKSGILLRDMPKF